jgi:hypothetical protein
MGESWDLMLQPLPPESVTSPFIARAKYYRRSEFDAVKWGGRDWQVVFLGSERFASLRSYVRLFRADMSAGPDGVRRRRPQARMRALKLATG